VAALADHPLERVCRHRSERLQLTFAQQALELIPESRECQFEASGDGIVIRAETESALERPIELLEEVYGGEIALGPLVIRYRQGAGLEEPHMGVRVLCAAKHFPAVRDDLLSRDATILDEEVLHAIGVVRATAPLAKLLGYSRHLAHLTSGGAREVMWLDHYAPCVPAISQPPNT
jgi:hypothetical protein